MRGRFPRASILGVLACWVAGCNSNATLFSDTFRNFTSGDVVPLTPGPASELVLVRLINETLNVVEFVVTAERQVLFIDDQGSPVIESTDSARSEKFTLQEKYPMQKNTCKKIQKNT